MFRRCAYACGWAINPSPARHGPESVPDAPRGWHEKLHARVTVQESLNAPVQLGQAVGTIALDLDRQPFAEYPLVALKQVGEGNLFQRTIDKIQLWLQ